MEWSELLALDDGSLNLAIEAVVFGRHWAPSGRSKALYGRRKTPTAQSPSTRETITRGMFPDYTADWSKAMALSTRYKLDVCYDLFDGDGRVGWFITCADAEIFVADDRDNGLPCPVEQALRVALCRLALWQAMQREEPAP